MARSHAEKMVAVRTGRDMETQLALATRPSACATQSLGILRVVEIS